MPIYHLIYRSVARVELTENQFLGLLLRWRNHNHQRGITGILLRGDGQYMQVLEGEEAAITSLYSQIRSDARHDSVVVLTDGPTSSRIFPQWSMGFLDTSPAKFNRVVGYVDPEFPTGPRAPHSSQLPTGYLALLQEFAIVQPVLF